MKVSDRIRLPRFDQPRQKGAPAVVAQSTTRPSLDPKHRVVELRNRREIRRV